MSTQPDLFETPPHVRSKTSYAAALKVKPKAATLRSLVLGYIQAHGPVTDQQIQEGLRMSGDTQRPRRRELEKSGLIKKLDENGVTEKGNNAKRWVVSDQSSQG